MATTMSQLLSDSLSRISLYPSGKTFCAFDANGDSPAPGYLGRLLRQESKRPGSSFMQITNGSENTFKKK